ncbi:hypothetical protein EDB83DRAFT_2445684, partial [Lactarius deliciosus]
FVGYLEKLQLFLYLAIPGRCLLRHSGWAWTATSGLVFAEFVERVVRSMEDDAVGFPMVNRVNKRHVRKVGTSALQPRGI